MTLPKNASLAVLFAAAVACGTSDDSPDTAPLATEPTSANVNGTPAGTPTNGNTGTQPPGTTTTTSTSLVVGSWLSTPTTFDTTIGAPAVGSAPLKVTHRILTHIGADGTTTTRLCALDFDDASIGLELVDPIENVNTPTPANVSIQQAVGDPYPVSSFTLVANKFTVNATKAGLSGLLVDMNIPITVTGKLTDEKTVTGTTTFTTTGTVWAATAQLGELTIPNPGDATPTAPITLKKVSADPTLNCAQASAL